PPKLAILLNQLCPCGCAGGGGTTMFCVLPEGDAGAGTTCPVKVFCTGGSCRARAGEASRVTQERAPSISSAPKERSPCLTRLTMLAASVSQIWSYSLRTLAPAFF